MSRSRHDRPAAGPALWAAALLCAIGFAAVVFALLVLLKPAANARAAIGTSTSLDGVTYSSPDARPVDLRIGDDAKLVRGAPSSISRGIWFAVFLDAANAGARPAVMTRDITLRDVTGDRFRPVALSAANPFRYRARTLPPGAAVPGPSTPAGSDLAAGGELLLYRIPRSAYEPGPLELGLLHGGRSEDSPSPTAAALTCRAERSSGIELPPRPPGGGSLRQTAAHGRRRARRSPARSPRGRRDGRRRRPR